MNANFRRLIFLAFFLTTLACAAALWADPPSRVGRLKLIDGVVSFMPVALDDWAPATSNYPLTTGDSLWTAAGARVELRLGSAAVRLGAETEFSILLLDDRAVQLRLLRGSLHVRLRELQSDESFDVATPVADISLLEPGSYRIDVRAGGATEIVVRSGQARMDTEAASVTVLPNQQAAVTVRDTVAFGFRVAPAPDEWELWCMQRDRREDRYASTRYVPTTMVGYEDLDEWGSWLVLPDHGIAWRPKGVAVGWAPYRFGRWAWVRPWGWTWIDDAPWGFAPFHYGRWVSVIGEWYWLPGAFVARPVYAPALVVFIGGTDWEQGFTFGAGIGWFPLGPREVYVPPYRASVEYVRNVNRPYVTGIDAARVDVRNVPYANRAKPGAVTVVSRRTFAGSEPVAPAAVRLAESELGRAPVTGTAPSLAPAPDSIQARPRGASQPETRPPVAQRPGFRLVNPSRESVEQARLEPAVAPRAQRKAASPAGSQQQVKRVRKLVNGPNGPVWIWVVEEEPGDG